MKIFQVVILLIFGFTLVVGVLIFAGILPGYQTGNSGIGGEVVLWGTIPNSEFSVFLNNFNKDHREEFALRYVYKDPANFESDYIQALAVGQGPDLVFFPDDMIYRFSNTLEPIPYDNFSARNFRDTYVEGAEIFLNSEGILALPVTVDPLVMYYNRRLMDNAGITQIPRNWSQVISYIDQLTELDGRRNIVTSAVALGEFANITNAKDILSALILQVDNPIVDIGSRGPESALGIQGDPNLNSTIAAVRFFTQFADQSKSTYTWSRALPDARQAFLAEQLAIYLGKVSELDDIQLRNPNLNFDVAIIPQRDQSSLRRTIGDFTGIGVLRNSTNKQTAFAVAFYLSNQVNTNYLVQMVGLPPVRRDLLANPRPDAISPVAYGSAIISESWLDPNPNQTYNIFAQMAEDTLLNRKTVERAVLDASRQLDLIFIGSNE